MNDTDIFVLANKIARSFHGKHLPTVSLEDVRQDAVVEILKWQEKFKTPSYLFTKVRGVLLDRYGRLWRQHYAHTAVDVAAADEPGALDVDEPGQIVSDVREAVATLEPKPRAVMELHLQGLTQKEIAARLGVGQPYVSQIMKAARESLREMLGDYA